MLLMIRRYRAIRPVSVEVILAAPAVCLVISLGGAPLPESHRCCQLTAVYRKAGNRYSILTPIKLAA